MNVEVYVFEDADGVLDTFTTLDANEAREYAKKNGRKWIAQTFEYADSELVEDHTPEKAQCRHCERDIVLDPNDGWIDPEATGDDSVWRETCDSHDTFTAEHEPLEPEPAI